MCTRVVYVERQYTNIRIDPNCVVTNFFCLVLMGALFPVPVKIATLISNHRNRYHPNSTIVRAGYFISGAMIVISLALPILLYHADNITQKAAILSSIGIILQDVSIALYYKFYHHDVYLDDFSQQ